MYLEQERSEYPRIISVMIIKKAVRSLIFYKNMFVVSPCRVL